MRQTSEQQLHVGKAEAMEMTGGFRAIVAFLLVTVIRLAQKKHRHLPFILRPSPYEIAMCDLVSFRVFEKPAWETFGYRRHVHMSSRFPGI